MHDRVLPTPPSFPCLHQRSTRLCYQLLIAHVCWWCKMFSPNCQPVWLLTSPKWSWFPGNVVKTLEPIFNESKCSLMRFGSNKSSSHHVYSINDHIIQSTSQHKDLGIIVSSDLSWSDHILYISAKAYKTLGLLRHSFCKSNSVTSKKLLYISLVRSRSNPMPQYQVYP